MSVEWYYRTISMQILFNIPFIVCLHAERGVTESDRLGKGYSSFSAKQTTNTQSKLRVIDCQGDNKYRNIITQLKHKCRVESNREQKAGKGSKYIST